MRVPYCVSNVWSLKSNLVAAAQCLTKLSIEVGCQDSRAKENQTADPALVLSPQRTLAYPDTVTH